MLKRVVVLLTAIFLLSFIAISTTMVDSARASPVLTYSTVDQMATQWDHASVVMPLWVGKSSAQRVETITSNSYLIDAKRITNSRPASAKRGAYVVMTAVYIDAGTTAKRPYVMRA